MSCASSTRLEGAPFLTNKDWTNRKVLDGFTQHLNGEKTEFPVSPSSVTICTKFKNDRMI